MYLSISGFHEKIEKHFVRVNSKTRNARRCAHFGQSDRTKKKNRNISKPSGTTYTVTII